ncbi:hypothetical protein CsatB_017554 [Cannabis sativa]
MPDNKTITSPTQYDVVNAKWDMCLDLSLHCFVYGSFGGALAGLLLFRSLVTQWASIAFRSVIGIGSAYTQSQQLLSSSSSSQSSSTKDNQTLESSVKPNFSIHNNVDLMLDLI